MEKECYLGIDVSKGYADFILLDHQQKVVETVFDLNDHAAGHKKLLELITNWQQQGLEQLYCGVESTGGYENNWYTFLKSIQQKGVTVHVARLNPKAVKAVADASLTRTLTDAVSAEIIAKYLILFTNKISYGTKSSLQNSGAFYEGRQHNTCIKMHTKQKVQLNNQLEKMLYQYFPEILVYCRHGIPTWLLLLLIKYPCASSVEKSGVAKLSAIKGIAKDKAIALLKKAEQSTAMVNKHAQHLISITAKEMLHKAVIAKEEKTYLQDIYKEDESVKLLQSIVGVGADTATLCVLEIEDINRFDTAAKLCSYFGLNPTYKQSGDGLWSKRMSKKGRSDIRAALYMASLSGIRSNEILKKLYARFRAKGMNHYAAMGVVMHKLLRIIYGVFKTKKKFDATVDEKNVTNATAKQAAVKQEKEATGNVEKTKRNRYQSTIINEAPISRMKYQKLKKAVSVPMPKARQHTDLLTAEANI